MKLATKIAHIITLLLIITSMLTFSACDNNPETCTHDWEAPTCINPAQCYKCDTYKTDGILGNHNYPERFRKFLHHLPFLVG